MIHTINYKGGRIPGRSGETMSTGLQVDECLKDEEGFYTIPATTLNRTFGNWATEQHWS